MPQYISYSTGANSTAQSTIVIPAPSNAQAGDLLIAHLLIHNSAATVAVPSDWFLAESNALYSDSKSYVLTKKHTGSEPTSYSFTMDGSYTSTGSILVFRNAMTSGFGISINSGTNFNTQNMDVYADGIWVNLFAESVTGTPTGIPTFTDTSGTMTSIYRFGNTDGSLAQTAYYQNISSDGKSGIKTITSSSSGVGICCSIALVKPNAQPNQPTNLSPSGTSQSPMIVNPDQFVFKWTFSDPDVGQVQSAYQVFVYDPSGTIVYNSMKQMGSDSSYPGITNLQHGTVYSWVVEIWDNADPPSTQLSSPQYFLLSAPPTLTSFYPANSDPASPTIVTTLTTQMNWGYNDPDGNPQSAYALTIVDNATGSVVYSVPKTTSSNNYLYVPENVLTSKRTYHWTVTVWDSTGLSTTADAGYFLVNLTPSALTNYRPLDNARVGIRPVFSAFIGEDVENDKQHFRLRIATNSRLMGSMYDTRNSTVGWEVNDGSNWIPFPVNGVDNTFKGMQIRYTSQSDLTEGVAYYWTIQPVDGTSGYLGSTIGTRRFKVGNQLQFKLKSPMSSSVQANKVVLVGHATIPTDGTVPASLLVEVCNNGLDDAPTWEDATNAYLTGAYYTFVNRTKTAASWAVDCRVTIQANDSLGAIEFDGIGLAFE